MCNIYQPCRSWFRHSPATRPRSTEASKSSVGVCCTSASLIGRFSSLIVRDLYFLVRTCETLDDIFLLLLLSLMMTDDDFPDDDDGRNNYDDPSSHCHRFYVSQAARVGLLKLHIGDSSALATHTPMLATWLGALVGDYFSARCYCVPAVSYLPHLTGSEVPAVFLSIVVAYSSSSPPTPFYACSEATVRGSG